MEATAQALIIRGGLCYATGWALRCFDNVGLKSPIFYLTAASYDSHTNPRVNDSIKIIRNEYKKLHKRPTK